MANKTVVRNAAYTRGGVSIRERHNERKNECYSNADIRLERSSMNVHFRQCEGTYTEAFDKLLGEGVISIRGLKADAKIIDEMIFDVNTSYFEENGGYDFAKRFYEEAYRLAVKEAGGERYILSAVMHADEINVGLSEDLSRDVYHYHLHVIYVPVVEKEVKWSKRCKDPALVGTVKEVINQVSHSKKWPRFKNENGEWVNSYSLLQDRFFEHMRDAGFNDFERGDYKSTQKHLSDMEYKLQQDKERECRLEQKITDLESKAETKKKQINTLDKKLAIRKSGVDDLDYLDNVGKKNMLGQIVLTTKELKKVRSLAEEGAEARGKIYELENQLYRASREIDYVKGQFNSLKRSYDDLLKKTSLFLAAVKLAPQKIKDFLTNIIQENKLAKQTQRALRKERSNDYER